MNKSAGFTLVEILVSIAVFGLVMAAMASAFFKIYHDWIRQRDGFQALSNAQWAIQLMSNEIRQANSTSVSDVSLSGMANHTFLYFLLADGNGNTNDKVWYWRGNGATYGNNTILYRSLTGKTATFTTANNARSELSRLLVNTTSGEIFNVTDQGSANATVAIELSLRPRPNQVEGFGNRNYSLRTKVRPRN